ncbi:MAG: PilZ domain-containing protein [Myxococcota bacterium]|nr:PilZ domain-containing protein [Myxococcota bacterium]
MDEETYLKARRLNLECSIAMVYADGFRVVSNCRNISETGAYVHTREPPREGTTITYSFYLGMIAQPFQGRALVRWVRPLPQPRGGEPSFGVGLEFESLNEMAQQWIALRIDEEEKERVDTNKAPVLDESGLNLDTQEFVAVDRLFDSLGLSSEPEEAFRPKGFMPESRPDRTEAAPAAAPERKPKPQAKVSEATEATAPPEPEAPIESPAEETGPRACILVDLTDTFQVQLRPFNTEREPSEATIEITPRFAEQGDGLELSDMAARSPVPLLLCPEQAYRQRLTEVHNNHPDLDTPVRHVSIEAGWRALIAQIGLHVVHRQEATDLHIIAPAGRKQLVHDTLTGVLSESWQARTQVHSQLDLLGGPGDPTVSQNEIELIIDLGLFETRLLIRTASGDQHIAYEPKLGLHALYNDLMERASLTLDATYGFEMDHDPIAEEIIREELATMKEVTNLNIKLEDVELELEAADLTDWWSDLANRLLDEARLLMSKAQVGHVDVIRLLERDGVWPTLDELLEDHLGSRSEKVDLEALWPTFAQRV